MDLDDMAGAIICLLLIFFIVLVITVGCVKGHSMDIELEKYKIEMEVNNGDIPTNEGE